MIIQLCGMSGAGKTTISNKLKQVGRLHGIEVEILDGDHYRKTISKGLGFSKKDRNENIRRLGKIADGFSHQGVIAIISAINPYESIRKELETMYMNVKTVFVDCSKNILIKRDTKGLYKRAMLHDGHPDKINNLSGINDSFEIPEHPDLHLHTDIDSPDYCVEQILKLIRSNMEVI